MNKNAADKIARESVFDQLNDISGLTYEEALNKAELTYQVGKAPLFWENKVEIEGADPYVSFESSPQHAQIIRLDRREPLGVTKNDYGIVQVDEAYSIVSDLVTDGYPMLRGGYTGAGERTYMVLKGKDEISLYDEEKIFCTIVVTNAYDGTESLTARIAAFNTATQVLMTTGDLVKLRHSKHVLKRLSDKRKILKKASESWTEFKNAYDKLTRVQIKDDQAKIYFLALLPEKDDESTNQRGANIRERMFKLYSGEGMGSKLPCAKGTLWGAYMAAIEDCEYHRVVRKSKLRDSRSQEIYSRIQGPMAMQKASAYGMALTMADRFGSFIGGN